MWTRQSTFAELSADGYDQLDIYCAHCRGTSSKRLAFLARYWRESESLSSVIGRLRCAKCGQRPEPSAVKPGRQADAPGAGRRA
jgi:hypothetical protein